MSFQAKFQFEPGQDKRMAKQDIPSGLEILVNHKYDHNPEADMPNDVLTGKRITLRAVELPILTPCINGKMILQSGGQ